MSKKHFEWAAEYCRAMRKGASDVFKTHEALYIEDAFADLFRKFGPNFDEQRFREACNRTD